MGKEEKNFYWVKLTTDFFRDGGPIDILLQQENGSEYVTIYTMLCLRTANTNGVLCSMCNGLVFPYTIKQIALDCKYFSIDTVRVAMELFKKLGLVIENTDGTLQIADIEKMVGGESKWAKYKRQERARIENSGPALIGQSPTENGQCPIEIGQNVGQSLDIVQQEYRDKSIEFKYNNNINSVGAEQLEIASSQAVKTAFISLTLNTGEEFAIYDQDIAEWKALYPAVDVEQELRKMKGWIDSHPNRRKTKRGIKSFCNSWLSREQDNGRNRKPERQQDQKPVQNNKFNNFHQRDYDYADLERQLLD